MSRLPSKIIGILAGALTVAALGTVPALADHSKIDGSITANGDTCSWTDGSTSDNPPNTLTVDRTTINAPGGNLSCSGGVSATLNNDPTATFDDANGTATVDLLDVTLTQFGMQCRYQARDVEGQRDGTTRHYTASVSVPLSSGGFGCPNPLNADASLTLH
ncbi:hypothetical protein SAMN05216266_102304 [Amycolatopsis marina]|uniref:Neocarzinostatin family protein n=1 Tax=Amycolatopsis marina TaxID=490629 RepID=A0A1I0WXN8_9PSEU|nr:hypothetical protein [Amycolatopsis marina]SFA93495.1 hypothetical protein SAMN05216266_102304 [Amycolatopsis marina]